MTDWLLYNPIAHRGLHKAKTIPENSLAAFEASVNAGYPIELDIRMPRSGPPIVLHDESLSRLTGIGGTVSDSDFTDLAELNLYSTNQKIPSLLQVLDLVNGKVPLLIELKTTEHSARMEFAVFQILRRYSGKFAVQSFDSFSVAWFKNNAPRFMRGLVCEKMTDLAQEEIEDCDPDFLACEHRRLPETKQGKPLLAWTVRSNSEAIAARKVADNLIFEDFLPEVA